MGGARGAGAAPGMPVTGGFDGAVRSVDELLRRRRAEEAESLCDALVADHPRRFEAWLLRARVHQQRGRPEAMLAAAERAVQLEPASTVARFIAAEALLQCGLVAEATERLAMLEADAADDAAVWRRLVEFHAHCGRHAEVERCARRALRIRPCDADVLYALASALIALGRLEEAERQLEELIRLAPGDGDARHGLATLRRQTRERNHVDELERALAAARAPAMQVPLYFALAKELEDLGEYERAFATLKRGADLRRAMLSYRVEADEETIEQIARTFDAAWAERAAPGWHVDGPLFIVGLPRSGTTLVDRILSRHSAVTSVGEINDLALAVVRHAGGAGDKAELVARAAEADLTALGRSHWRAVLGRGARGRLVIDKTPLNFLYLGLIARALPRARVIHVWRHPVASCFAMYKTLFRMGYPFSYDLGDLARYFLAYHRLMRHWRESFPGRFLDVQYEALVDDQEGTSRRLVEHCGLQWESACLDFHENDSPVATASAVQVRQPIYRHARDLWRRYETQLRPLIDMLERGGVEVA